MDRCVRIRVILILASCARRTCNLRIASSRYGEPKWSIRVVHWHWVLTGRCLIVVGALFIRLSRHCLRMRYARNTFYGRRLRRLHLQMLLQLLSFVQWLHGRPTIIISLDRLRRDWPVREIVVVVSQELIV